MEKVESLDSIFNEMFELIIDKIDAAETKEERDDLISKVNNIDLNELFQEYSRDMIDFMKKTMHEEVSKVRKKDEVFLKRHEKLWNDGFVASEAMYLFCYECAQNYMEHVDSIDVDSKKDNQFTFIAMNHIHGRALQEFLEIITLMKNGFADGAYARWRSMYELSIIASFITDNGDIVAKAYIEASDSEDRYDWAKASHKFDNKKYKHITFKNIAEKSDLYSEEWYKQYLLANKIIHASPQGTFARLSNMKTNNIILTGRSNYGITTPAEHSAISLAQITTMFFNIFPSSDEILAIKCINEWVDVIREIYFKIHDETFLEVKPINFRKE